jgi:hypothetical protein
MNALTIVPGKPDKEAAEEFRARAAEAAAPFLQVVNEAKAAGFDIGVQFGPIWNGSIGIQMIKVLKEF